MATKKVWASRGKATRAEPIVARYEQGLVHHVGILAALEEEMVQFVPGEPGESPNRVDATIWACTELTARRNTRRHLGALMQTPLVFTTWKWTGTDPARQFPAEAVNILYAMLTATTTRPFAWCA